MYHVRIHVRIVSWPHSLELLSLSISQGSCLPNTSLWQDTLEPWGIFQSVDYLIAESLHTLIKCGMSREILPFWGEIVLQRCLCLISLQSHSRMLRRDHSLVRSGFSSLARRRCWGYFALVAISCFQQSHLAFLMDVRSHSLTNINQNMQYMLPTWDQPPRIFQLLFCFEEVITSWGVWPELAALL